MTEKMVKNLEKTGDHRTLCALNGWLGEGVGAYLCTIISVHGSSPRPVGSLFAVADDGREAGSVSGGCVEEALVLSLPGNEGDGPWLQQYGLSAEENARLGLPCGGHLALMVERIKPQSSHHDLLESLVLMLDEGESCALELHIESGQWLIGSASPGDKPALEDPIWRNVFGPMRQLLLVGAGELARCVSQVALMLGYRVLLCDPRQDKLDSWAQSGVEPLCCMPDEAVSEWGDNPFTAIATLSHDPRIDDMALMEALKSQAFYVGALGSKRTNANRRERLAQLDLSEQQIARLHGPMGLDIGSKTPAEIAVSLMAHITQVTNR